MRAGWLKATALLLPALLLAGCGFSQRADRLYPTLQAELEQTLAAAFPTPTAAFNPEPTLAIPETGGGPPLVITQPLPAITVIAVSPPLVSVSVATNCRGGPGPGYALLGTLLPGEQAVVVGRSPALNFWIIQDPRGAGSCWLWGQYAALAGDLNSVPVVDAPGQPPVLPAVLIPQTGATPLPTAAPTAIPAGQACALTRQWLPAGTQVMRNAVFNARWTVQNTGGEAWNVGEVEAVYASGDALHGAVDRYPLPEAVQPGAEVEVVVAMKAPDIPQRYTTYWALVRGGETMCSLPLTIEVVP